MEIRVNGLEKALEELKGGLDPNTLSQWARVVENEARDLCGDIGGERIKFEGSLASEFHIQAFDIRDTECIQHAIRNNLDAMPFTTRVVFEKTIDILEEEKMKG